MNEQHMCEHEHCISIETQEYHNPDNTTEWLCFDHAIANGFCVWCQNFAAGEERFDFSEHHGGTRGYHPECWQEFVCEMGECDGGYDDDPYNFNPYFEGWYDPDMDFENEDSNGRDIGEGSETRGFFMDVDGSTVHVQGNPDMTDEQAEVVANIVRATRAKMSKKGSK